MVGPLFLDRTRRSRLAYTTAFAQIRRLARKAGIPAANQITPHSLRHTFRHRGSLAAGVPLQDVQDAAGHRDPRTTRRYDEAATISTGIPHAFWLGTSAERGTSRPDDTAHERVRWSRRAARSAVG